MSVGVVGLKFPRGGRLACRPLFVVEGMAACLTAAMHIGCMYSRWQHHTDAVSILF
jgi:hypothetical protein